MLAAPFIAGIIYISSWLVWGIAYLTGWLVELGAVILDWALTGIPYQYTTGGIVEIGWTMVRDLTNMFFVVALVFIGLTTALRISGYQTKKMLTTLIIIILLVNFTPVIVGLIVDASNIVMNFFVEGLRGGEFVGNQWAALKAINSGSFLQEGMNPFEQIERLISSLAIIVMDIVLFFILGVYTLVFLARYVAIWILVILSPLAFASYILPATRGFWKLWWNQLFQWCIIGIAAGFFLYLGTHLLGNLPEIPSEGAVGLVELIIKMMPYIFVAMFFVIGFFIALSTSAMGATQIMAVAKRGGKAAGKKLAGRSWEGTTGITKRMITVAEKERKTLTRYYRAGHEGKRLSRRQALGEAIKHRWMTKAKIPRRIWGRPVKVQPKMVIKTTMKGITKAGWKETKAAAKGSWSAVKESASAGWRAAIKAPKKKAGFECPQCHHKQSKGANFCESCGFQF